VVVGTGTLVVFTTVVVVFAGLVVLTVVFAGFTVVVVVVAGFDIILFYFLIIKE
jgi:hypothetical protein